jgi:RNA polymerase sigma factor (sigma-70 family)
MMIASWELPEPQGAAMPESPSDVDFVRRLNRRTESSAAELDHRYRHKLCQLVGRELDRALRSREDPEDVVQTVFRTYFRRAAQGEFHITSTADLWALLAKITRRKILKRVEYHQAEKRSLGAESGLHAGLESTREPGPVDAAIAIDLACQAMQGLDSVAAEVFQLRLTGCTEREIAEQLNCTRAEVRLKLGQIRERLSKAGETDLEN